MLFRKLLVLLAFIGVVHAADLKVSLDDYGSANGRAIHTHYFVFNTDDQTLIEGENKNNWAGLYEKGASNDWGNVKQWNWVRSLKIDKNHYNGFARDHGFEIKHAREFTPGNHLKPGKYELRFFKNNSYNTFASFSLDYYSDAVDPTFSLERVSDNEVTLQNVKYAEGAYMAVFKKNASDNAENILTQSRVSSDMMSVWIDISMLPAGIYEARLFYAYKNSSVAKVEFTIDGDINPTDIFEDSIYTGGTLEAKIKSLPANKNRYDWVGMFQQGAEHKLNNLVAWNYVSKAAGGKLSLIQYKKNLLVDGTFKLVYFTNNSYSQLVSSNQGTITVDMQQNAISMTASEDGHDINLKITNYDPSRKDWIASFRKGKEFKSGNVYTWSYVSKMETWRGLNYRWFGQNYPHQELKDKQGITDDDIVYVLFRDDTYEVIATATVPRRL